MHGRAAGEAGLDELTVTGESLWAEVRGGEIGGGGLEPESVGLQRRALAELAGGATARENAGLIEAVLRGQDRGARREIVLLNAGAALVVGGLSATLSDGVGRAQESLDRGAALAVLERLRAFQPAPG